MAEEPHEAWRGRYSTMDYTYSRMLYMYLYLFVHVYKDNVHQFIKITCTHYVVNTV